MKNLTNYNIGESLIQNAMVKCKASLDLTEDEIETILISSKQKVYEIVGDVPNE